MATFAMIRKDILDRNEMPPISKGGYLPERFKNGVFLVVRDSTIESDEFNTKIRIHKYTFKVCGIDFEYFKTRKDAYEKRG